MQSIIQSAMPSLMDLLGVLLAGVIAWASNTARRRWGLAIEANHREALQSAIMTGARLALAGKLDAQAAIALILSHVQASVPDAVGALKPSTDVLTNLARAKLQEAAQVSGQAALAEALRRAGAR